MEDPFPEKAVHGGMVKKYRRGQNREILDFSASLNPFPPSVDWSLYLAHLDEYPDDTYAELKEVIGRTFQRRVEEISVGNGSIELIRVFCRAVLKEGDGVLIEHPTFGEYELSARLCGARLSSREHARVFFLCNPNNPTGELVRKDDVLARLHDLSSKGGMLFLDEAFIDLSSPDESLVDIEDPALFVARSLTKSFAIPGLRFGYGFGDEDLVEQMETLRLPWTVNAVAEAYALQAFKVYGELARSRKLIAIEREYLTRGLSGLDLTCSSSMANYLLVHLPMRAGLLHERLLGRGILVRDCTSFGLPDAIRIAVRTREENSRLLEVLRECLP